MTLIVFQLGMAMRMREYAVHADYAHMREYADADENAEQKVLLNYKEIFIDFLLSFKEQTNKLSRAEIILLLFCCLIVRLANTTIKYYQNILKSKGPPKSRMTKIYASGPQHMDLHSNFSHSSV